MTFRLFLTTALAVAGLVLAGCSKPPEPATEAPKAEAVETSEAEPTHALSGELEEAAAADSHLVIRTDDGQRHRVEVHSGTKMNPFRHAAEQIGAGTKEMAQATASSVKKGTMVAVRYTEKEGKLVAHHVQHASGQTVKKTEAIVHRIDDDGRKIVVKTKDGAEEVYEVSKDATHASARKIASVGKAAGAEIKSGTKATIHFTEEAGKKVAHFFHH